MRSDVAAAVTAALVATAVLVAPGRVPHGETPESDGPSRALAMNRSGGRSGSPRTALTTDDIVETLILLALAFRSGLPTCDVLEAVSARSAEAPGTDLRQVATALRWGASDDEAWAAVDARWAPAARAIALAARAGIAPGPLLLRAADDVGSAELERLEVSAAKVTVRLVLPLGLVLLPAFVLTTVLPVVAALARQVLSAA